MSHLPTLGDSPIFKQLPTSVLAHLDGAGSDLLSRGWVSTADAQIAVIHRGPRLEVVSTRTNERIAAWTFGTDTSSRNSSRRRDSPEVGQTYEITCCVELFGPSNTGINSIGAGVRSASGSSTPIETTNQHNHPLQRRLLVVGLASGLVCVFDIRSSRIIRAVQMSHRITALAILGNGGSAYGGSVVGGCHDLGLAGLGMQLRNNLLAEELLFFRGIVAVGTQEGHIYLLDIALDDADDTKAAGYAPTFLDSDESNPAEPFFIDVGSGQNSSENGKPNLANIRAAALRRGEHLCMALNDSAYTKGKTVFRHTSNQTGETSHFDESEVVVSALKYVPQLASLLAGFNFGSWQMFNLMQCSNASIATSASFSSDYDKNINVPVTAFTFQEPENDPRNFCYVWSIKCDNDWDTEVEKASDLESKATISLYSLAYENRDDGGDQYGVLYNGLTQCNKAFQHTLEADPQLNQEVVGTLCIASYTLEPGMARSVSGAVGNIGLNVSEADNMLCNLGMTAFLWQCFTKTPKGRQAAHHYLGVFDLNLWYQEHMPNIVQLGEGVQCPYFSFCSLEEVLLSANNDVMSTAGNGSDLQAYDPTSKGLIHVCVDMSTISRYQSLSKVEQHFYPSSLAFELICLVNNGFVYASHLGLQRKVLLELQTRGRSNLVEPDHLFQLCTIAGLISNDTVASISKDATSMDQRSALLTVALEHHLVNFLIGCVNQWNDGKYAYAGCTLKVILDWAWSCVSNMKQNIDKITIPLFDWSCVELNESTRKTLVQISQQLKHLCIIIAEIMKMSANGNHFSIDSDYYKELGLKHSVTQLINTYLEAILWFFNAGLLPERPPSNDVNGDNPYPASHLAIKYDERRSKMKNKLSEWNYENKGIHCLIIDGLCEEMGPEMKTNFEREGEGRKEYPPPNLRSLLMAYLIHKDNEFPGEGSINLLNRHRIVQYLFHDMANCLGDKWNDLVNNLIKFPAAFSVPPSLIKLTQAFWLLDHGDFEEAMVMLLDPLILGNDILVWQHRAILVAFLVQDQPKLALKYTKIRQPPQKDMFDVELNVAILLANGMVHEAFQFQRQKGRNSEHERVQLLSYFFAKSEMLGKLDSILQLPLAISEEKALERYLKEGINSNANLRQEVLLMYYLQRSRFHEAMGLNEHLEKQSSSRKPCVLGNTRKAIMERYAHRLPDVSSRSQPKRFKASSGQSDFPVPLSIDIRSSDFIPAFHTGSIREKLEGTSSAYYNLQEFSVQPTTPFRPKQTRKDIGLFNRKGQFPIRNGNISSVSKRKYSEISVAVFAAEEVDAGDKSFFDDRICSNTPKTAKTPNLVVEDPSNETPCKQRLLKFPSSIADKTLSVLSTPTIERKTLSKLSFLEVASKPQDNGEISKQKSLPVTPKHSILKVSRPSGRGTGPFSESFSPEERFDGFSDLMQTKTADDTNMTSNKPDSEDWLTKPSSHSMYNSNNRSRESTPGKSLRFNVPKRIPPKMVELDEDMKSQGIVDSKQNSADSSSLLEISDDNKNDDSLQRKTGETSEIDEPETEEDLVEDEIVFIEKSDNGPVTHLKNEKEEGKRQYIKQMEPGSSVDVADVNIEIHRCIEEPTVPDIKSVDEENLDSISHLEEDVGQIKEDINENDSNDHVTSASMYAEISVYQATDNMSPNDTVMTHRIKDIARKSLALDNVNKIDVTNEELETLANEEGKDKSYMISDMSVYNPIEEGEKTIDSTLIRQMAHEACSQAEDAVHVDEQELNISATAKISDMSVYEPTLSKEEGSLNKSIIRQMAEEAYIKPQEITHMDEKDTTENTIAEATDISVYIPSEMKKGDNLSNITVIRKMAQDAHNQPSEITQVNEKKTSLDSSKNDLEMSVYIDNAKRISPDPEVTLNFQIAQNKPDRKHLLIADKNSAGSTDQAGLLYPPDQNPDISVYSIKAGNESPAQNFGFLKSLATKQIKDIKTNLDVTDNMTPRSFDFSNPHSASPAAAAKQRHRSKHDSSSEMSGPIYLFSEPVIPISDKKWAQESTQVQGIINENLSFQDKLSEKSESKEQEPQQEIGVITEDDKSKLGIDSKINKSVHVAKQQANVGSFDKKLSKKYHTGIASTQSDLTKFHFSPPVVSLGTMPDSLEADSSFHGWNTYASPSSNKQIQPQFKFTAAESVLPLEKVPIAADKRNELDGKDLTISSSRKDQEFAIDETGNSSEYLKRVDSNQEVVHKKSLNKDSNNDNSEQRVSAHWEVCQDVTNNKTRRESGGTTVKSSPSTRARKKTESENKKSNTHVSSQEQNQKDGNAEKEADDEKKRANNDSTIIPIVETPITPSRRGHRLTIPENTTSLSPRRSRRISENSTKSNILEADSQKCSSESIDESQHTVLNPNINKSEQPEGTRSRSVSPTSSVTDCLQTPIRRSRRLSERSTTPLREIPEELSDMEENKKRIRSTSTTPRKSGRISPAPGTPRRSRRTSAEPAHTVSIMETLVEHEDEINGQEAKISQDVSMVGSKSVSTPHTRIKKRTSRSRVSENTQLEDIEEDATVEIVTPIKSASNVEVNDLHHSSPTKSVTEDSISPTGNIASIKEHVIVAHDDGFTVSQTNEAEVDLSPKRVTRSSSKSSSTSTPSKTSEKIRRTQEVTKKPPLKIVKDPFSPQLTDEQRKKLHELKEANKNQPRKKYAAIKKVKSKRL